MHWSYVHQAFHFFCKHPGFPTGALEKIKKKEASLRQDDTEAHDLDQLKAHVRWTFFDPYIFPS